MIKLFKKNFGSVLERVAKNGNRKLFNKKPEILNATMNNPSIIPIIKKEVNPTLPKYSGFRNRNCIPYFVPICAVIIPKSNNQKNRNDLFFLKYITNN
jgi:hypothetical protein